MNIPAEIKRMRAEACEEQRQELTSNFEKLSPENRIELVMYSRMLTKKEAADAQSERLWKAFYRLNDEGQRLAMEYIHTLALNPKYRKEINYETLS